MFEVSNVPRALARRLPPPMLFAALATSAAAQVPTEVQLPGTQPLESPSLEDVQKCDNCHAGYNPAVEPWRGWAGSMMAHATRDPIFWATVAVAEQDFPGAGDFCIRCHTPTGWLEGRSTPTNGAALVSASDGDGVTCDACHRAVDPAGSELAGVQFPPFLANDEGAPPTGYHGSAMLVMHPTNVKLGPYSDPASPHAALQSKFHRRSDFCGTCHDVSNPVVGDLAPNNGAMTPLAPGTFSGVPGAPVDQKAAFNNFPFAYGVVERTYSEHMASAFPTLLVSQFGSLPAEFRDGSIEDAWAAATASTATGDYADGTARTFSCQTCHMPPLNGKGANKPSTPVRPDVPRHYMNGGNHWMPAILKHLDAQGKLVLGGGLSATERAALDEGAARALDLLEASAELEVDGNTARVVNLTGHKLITGFPEGRRMWVRTRWYDGAQALIREDGAYGAIQVTIGGQPAVVESILDPQDPYARVYDAHFGMTQEWAAALVSLGYPPTLPLAFDRVTGQVSRTLGDVAGGAPGTHGETFHFALNDVLIADSRIPPYGMRYDDALLRNVSPVPGTQYGAPGPGGVYDAYDEWTLSPPAGATHADVELLYQGTSWEYVQFLALANHGTDPLLGATGADLRDAWLATGMAAPVVVDHATWTAPVTPWTDLGGGVGGTFGVPSLVGVGDLSPGSTVTLATTQALPGAPCLVLIGTSRVDLPFYGGTLFPSPDLVISGLSIGPAGALTLAGTWPSGIPAGLTFVFQEWMVDAGAVFGVAGTNGLQAVSP